MSASQPNISAKASSRRSNRAAAHRSGANHGSCASSIREVKVPIDEDRTVHIYEAYQYHEQFLAEYRDQYDPQTLQRILQGKDVSEEQYRAARCNLDALRRRQREIFRDVDVLITPTVPISPPTIADLQSGLPELRKRELIMLRNTRPFNVLGLPSITVPCGFTAEGLPVGMQISAAPGAERKVLGDCAPVRAAYRMASAFTARAGIVRPNPLAGCSLWKLF